MSAVSSGTHNELHEHKTETDVNYCQQMYSNMTLRLYFVCICTPNLELSDQGSCVRIVTRPKNGRVDILPIIDSVIFLLSAASKSAWITRRGPLRPETEVKGPLMPRPLYPQERAPADRTPNPVYTVLVRAKLQLKLGLCLIIHSTLKKCGMVEIHPHILNLGTR